MPNSVGTIFQKTSDISNVRSDCARYRISIDILSICMALYFGDVIKKLPAVRGQALKFPLHLRPKGGPCTS